MIEMGSQDLYLAKGDFDGLLQAAGGIGYDEKVFSNLANWPGRPRVPARHFYELLGAKNYRCIDIGKEYGAIPHDLNFPFTDSSLRSQFDLVTDFGTNEHVFNTVEAYKTMHWLCKTGGLIVIQQAVYDGNGYYNYDSSWFEGMAAANDYRILFSSFIVRFYGLDQRTQSAQAWKQDYGESFGNDAFHIPLSNQLLRVIDWSKFDPSLEICYVFEKTTDQEFRYAYQGDDDCVANNHYGYQLQFLPSPPSRTYIPLRERSEDGMERGVLESITSKAIARHLLGRLTKKIKVPGLRS